MSPDAAPDAAAPPKLMFGIDTSPAPGESYTDALALSRGAGATFVPQAIDWTMIEAGPDDTFASAIIDTKKWDVTGPFTADATAGVVHYTASAATTGDNLRARYALDGMTVDASITATLDSTGSTQATLLLRFGAAATAGNRCSDPGDEFAAIVLTATGSGPVVATATCEDGVFANHGVATATATQTLHVSRTASQLVFTAGTTQVAAIALPAAFAGPARVGVFAGNSAGAAAVDFSTLHVHGQATWDNPSDRFVGVDAAFDVPAVLEAIHGPLHTPLVINLRTINTVTAELPSDLRDVDGTTGLVDMSRADIRQRYHDVIDNLLSRMPSVTIAGFAVGNEFDVYLGASATAWSQFATFATDAISYARTKLPAGTLISVTATTKALLDHAAQLASVESAADAVFVTYYPLASDFTALDPSVVATDMASFIAAAPKPLLFIEAGYPSAASSASCPTCTGSEAKQAAFFHAMFVATDTYPTTQLRGFSVSWLTDAPDATVAGWEQYYGVASPAFVAYLATLGVRTQTGTPKQAWTQIMTDAAARGL